MTILSLDDEKRLRELAHGVAKDIEDVDVLLARLGFTREDYNELTETRAFREMLTQAASEWEGAANTHKRIKLKAALNIETALPQFYHAMIDDKEPLSSKVKAFEAVARVAGLGNPELLPAGGGQFFKLEINLGNGEKPLVIDATPTHLTPEVAYSESEAIPPAPKFSSARSGLSKVLDGVKTGDW